MTDPKILNDIKRKITRAKNDDQIIYMVKVGIKIPEWMDSTETEVWSDIVIVNEAVHFAILQLLKSCSKKEGNNV